MRHLVEPVHAHDLLHQVRLAADVGTPGRRLRQHPAFRFRHGEAESLQHGELLRRVDLHARERLHPVEAERDLDLADRRLSGDGELGRLSAAKLQDQARADLRSGLHEGRVDAALEPIACVRIDPEPAAGGGDTDRIEIGRLQEDIHGLRRAACRGAADDTADALRAGVVRDHGD
jgi:hypothetical protein